MKPETKEGPHRTLHRDLLLPCGFLPVVEMAGHGPPENKQRRMKLRSTAAKDTQNDQDDEEDGIYSDENEMYPSVVVPEITIRGPFVQGNR